MINVTSALLGAVNDWTAATSRGDGFLVNTPWAYTDGDTVAVLAEPYQNGWRVSDRAEAMDRLAMWGVDASSGKAGQAVETIRKAAGLVPTGSQPTEVATFGAPGDLGAMMIMVAQAASQIEGLRWLARDVPAQTFEERLLSRIEHLAAARHWQYQRRVPVKLRHGRTKHVTAAVQGSRATAYIQAVSDADRDRSTESCYYLFERSTIDKEYRIAALAGDPAKWGTALRRDLEDVATVVEFENPLDLESRLDQITGPIPVG